MVVEIVACGYGDDALGFAVSLCYRKGSYTIEENWNMVLLEKFKRCHWCHNIKFWKPNNFEDWDDLD